jgi:hypothetical protein
MIGWTLLNKIRRLCETIFPGGVLNETYWIGTKLTNHHSTALVTVSVIPIPTFPGITTSLSVAGIKSALKNGGE